MDLLQLKMCDVQGRLFELSVDHKCSSKDFVKAFMNSHVAKALDSKFNHMQWAGEAYLFDELAAQYQDVLWKNGQVYSKDILYWTGYIYRYWHYMTGETSAKIYKTANANVMFRNYLMFHTMDPKMAIESLIDIKRQKDAHA